MFLSLTREPDPGDMYTFFVIASLMGGQAPDRDKMNIAQVIHLERSGTPLIFAIFTVDGVFFLKKAGKVLFQHLTVRFSCPKTG